MGLFVPGFCTMDVVWSVPTCVLVCKTGVVLGCFHVLTTSHQCVRAFLCGTFLCLLLDSLRVIRFRATPVGSDSRY